MPTLTNVFRSVAPKRPLTGIAQDWLTAIIGGLRENSPLLAVIAVMLFASDAVSHAAGRSERVLDRATYQGLTALPIACLAAVFVIWFLHLTLVRKVSILSSEAWRSVFGDFFGRERIALALPVLLAWPLMTASFSQVKTLIPIVQPFYLDTTLHELDRALHFGLDPWQLLHPILGHPLITYAIDRLYALWFFVVYAAMLLQMVAVGDRRRRLQFLFSSVLAWMLLGCLGATLLSSAGPTFYAEIVGTPDPYAPLVTYLRETNATVISFFGHDLRLDLLALHVRGMLWDFYERNSTMLGGGISAAPSMHVASTWLVARLLQTFGRRAAIFGWGFFGIILVGSIHLGWHYALDGYIAILCAWLIWRAVGWSLDRPVVQRLLWPAARRGGAA
jgi:hypothetical protein